MKKTYPKAILYKNIRKDKRVCSKCRQYIFGRGGFFVISVARGKYLCHACEKRENGENARRYVNTLQ